jgi:hypothetical protein
LVAGSAQNDKPPLGKIIFYEPEGEDLMHKSTAVTLIALLAILALALSACQQVQTLGPAATPSSGSTPSSSAATQTETAPNSATAGQGSGEPGPIHCLVEFEATVRQGPSTGMALTGTFDFKVDATGTLHGKLLQANQSEIMAGGQVNGRAINLVFIAGKAKYIFGVGTSQSKMANDSCGTIMGGPFVGPEPGDAGDWLASGRGAEPGSTPAICDSAGCLD